MEGTAGADGTDVASTGGGGRRGGKRAYYYNATQLCICKIYCMPCYDGLIIVMHTETSIDAQLPDHLHNAHTIIRSLLALVM